MWLKETNASKPLMTCRNVSDRRQNRDLDFCPASKGWGEPADCPTGVRHEGGVPETGFDKEHRNLSFRCEGEIQAVSHRKDQSTDAETGPPPPPPPEAS